MDTKVNKACSYSQRVHCVVKEMNEPKETVNVERTAMEANTGTDCEGGKLKEEKMANTEAFLDGIEPQESPWKSSSIYPHNQSLPTLLLCALTYTFDFTEGCPPPPLSEKELT